VVDDSATIRATVTMMLDSMLPDAQVSEAADGREGLEKVRAFSFDLILTDLNMPEMDGFGFLEGARKVPHCEKTPILVLTSQTEEWQVDRAFKLGANGYLN